MTTIPAFEELDRIIGLINSLSQPGPPRTPAEIHHLMDAVRALAIYAAGAWKSVWRSWMTSINLDYPTHAQALAALLQEASEALAQVDATLARSIEAGVEVDDAIYWRTRQRLEQVGAEFIKAWPGLTAPIDRDATGWREFRPLPVFAWDEVRQRAYMVVPEAAMSR
ncbi:hypothetical protein EP7_005622 (plasmid) [Isosphaeraceae bacterium EP7]